MANVVKNQIADLTSTGYKITAVILLAGLWQFVSMFFPHATFPSLIELAKLMPTMTAEQSLFRPEQHIPITLARILITSILAILSGILLGTAMGINSAIEDFFSVYILMALAFPGVILAFIAVIWFGQTTYTVPVFAGYFVVAPYAIINIWQGMESIDSDILEMTEFFGASQYLTWRYVYIPYLAPYIFSSMRIVLSISWKVMLVAELFGTQSGVGYVVNRFFIQQRNDLIIVWILPTMAVIYVFERLLRYVERQQFEWRPEPNSEINKGGA